MLTFDNFSLFFNELPIVRALVAYFHAGQTVVITGDNGSGKATLACGIMGVAGYNAQGKLIYDGHDISAWPIEKRAQAGIFLAYQYPLEIPGLGFTTFLHHAYRACHGNELSLSELDEKIKTACVHVGLPAELLQRDLSGFSGGQKKRLELVQMLVLQPKVIIFDEIDSGLDAPGITQVHEVIDAYKRDFPGTLFIIITHNVLFAQQCRPDVHLIMRAGELHVSA